MGNSINSDDEGAEGSPPLLRGQLVLVVYLQSRLAVEGTAVRDAARSTTRTTSMYNVGIEKAIPATLPHTPTCKVCSKVILLLRSLPPVAQNKKEDVDHNIKTKPPMICLLLLLQW